jgi:hypothetical protein
VVAWSSTAATSGFAKRRPRAQRQPANQPSYAQAALRSEQAPGAPRTDTVSKDVIASLHFEEPYKPSFGAVTANDLCKKALQVQGHDGAGSLASSPPPELPSSPASPSPASLAPKPSSKVVELFRDLISPVAGNNEYLSGRKQDDIMLSLAGFDLVWKVLQKVVEAVPCQKIAFTFINLDAKNSIGKVEAGIAPGAILLVQTRTHF